jgi:hypothetical protein
MERLSRTEQKEEEGEGDLKGPDSKGDPESRGLSEKPVP